MTTPAGEATRHYGKYRGTVVAVEDPMRQGRIMAMVPDVLESVPTTWAMPCVPFAGTQAGMWCVPPMGAGVWIEFEQGDVNHPIWSGGWYGSAAEVPALASVTPATISHVVVATTAQTTLMLSDQPGPTGGVLIKTAAGATLTMNETGVIISNGQGSMISLTSAGILISGPMVDVNQGALTII